MDTETKAEMEAEIEVLKALQKTCRTLRSSRARPLMGGPAGRWETKIADRLLELERTQTPSLPLKTAHAA